MLSTRILPRAGAARGGRMEFHFRPPSPPPRR